MSAVGYKMAFNARAKASMRELLRSKTWEEKVESIERMNEAGKLARKAMGARVNASTKGADEVYDGRT